MTISEPYAAELGRQVDELEAENARLKAACDGAYSWIDRHTAHIGRCDGGDKCTCGRTLVLFELSAAINGADEQSVS